MSYLKIRLAMYAILCRTIDFCTNDDLIDITVRRSRQGEKGQPGSRRMPSRGQVSSNVQNLPNRC